MLDALNTTLAPVIFSHSSARGVHNVTRNADDEVLLQLVGCLTGCAFTIITKSLSLSLSHCVLRKKTAES